MRPQCKRGHGGQRTRKFEEGLYQNFSRIVFQSMTIPPGRLQRCFGSSSKKSPILRESTGNNTDGGMAPK